MNKRSFYIEEKFTGDYGEISELFRTAYPPEEHICSASYLEWLYGQNPAGPAVISCAREHESNKLVGVYIVNPVTLWIDGQKTPAALSLNTFSHEDHRGQGMFTSLAKTCYERSKNEGLKCIIGFPNRMSYGGFVKKLGFKDMGTIPYLVKPLNYLNVAKSILFQPKSSASLTQINKEKYSHIIELDEQSLDSLDTFFNENRRASRYQTYRSANYYKWRFLNNPVNQYRIFAGQNEAGKTDAVLVVGLSSGKTKDIQIVDFRCSDQEAGHRMMKFLMGESKSGFSFVRGFAQTGTPEYQVFTTLGFVGKEKFSKGEVFLPFIYKDLEEKETPIPFNQWHISMSDTDVV